MDGSEVTQKRDEAVVSVAEPARKRGKVGNSNQTAKCEICGKQLLSFNLQKHMLVHYRRIRKEIGDELPEEIKEMLDRYPCDQCDRKFSYLSLLKFHKRSTHEGVKKILKKNHTCDVCGKMFHSKQLLLEHGNIHAGERPFVCNICGKDFTTRSTATSHQKVHISGNTFKCDKCDYSTRSKESFEAHEMVHLGIKPEECEICGKRYRVKSSLRHHKKIHISSPQFECETCGSKFTYKSSLNEHGRIHMRPKFVECEICGRSFLYEKAKEKHIRTKHTPTMQGIMVGTHAPLDS